MSDTHKKLLESRNYLLAVLMSATDAVVTIDKDGAVCFWNAAAHRLFGYSKQEIMGQPVSLLMPERFWNRHDDSMQNFVERGEGRNIGGAIEDTGRKEPWPTEEPPPAPLSAGTAVSSSFSFLHPSP
jgi:PAS domain-containing protein